MTEKISIDHASPRYPSRPRRSFFRRLDADKARKAIEYAMKRREERREKEEQEIAESRVEFQPSFPCSLTFSLISLTRSTINSSNCIH